LKQKLN